MISFQNGTKVRKNGFGLLRFVCYYHYTISMLVYCTAMYKLCDCWRKNIKKSSFRRNQLCRINFFSARGNKNWKVEYTTMGSIENKRPSAPPILLDTAVRCFRAIRVGLSIWLSKNYSSIEGQLE